MRWAIAKGKKTGGKDFKPGVSPNPAGRTPDPPELKAIKQLTKAEYSLLINRILNADLDKLKEFKGNVLERWLASGAEKAIDAGDFSRLETLVNRLIGVVPTKAEVTGTSTVINKYPTMTDEELDEKIKEIMWNKSEKKE